MSCDYIAEHVSCSCSPHDVLCLLRQFKTHPSASILLHPIDSFINSDCHLGLFTWIAIHNSDNVHSGQYTFSIHISSQILVETTFHYTSPCRSTSFLLIDKPSIHSASSNYPTVPSLATYSVHISQIFGWDNFPLHFPPCRPTSFLLIHKPSRNSASSNYPTVPSLASLISSYYSFCMAASNTSQLPPTINRWQPLICVDRLLFSPVQPVGYVLRHCPRAYNACQNDLVVINDLSACWLKADVLD